MEPNVEATPGATRTCSRCGERKATTAFHVWTQPNGELRVRADCKDCRSKARYHTRRRPEDTQKVCPGCHQTLDLDKFYARNNGRLRSRCYNCELTFKKEARQEESEARKEARMEAARKVVEQDQKVCAACGDLLPLSRFQASKDSLDGRKRCCGVCESLKRKKIGAEDEDRVRRWSNAMNLIKDTANTATRKRESGYAWDEDK